MLDLVVLLIGFAVGTLAVVAVNGVRRGSRPLPVVAPPARSASAAPARASAPRPAAAPPRPAPPRPAAPAAPPAATGPPVLAKGPSAPAAGTGPARVELEDGSDGVDLDEQPVTLGRGTDQVLRVPDARASRHHAVIRRRSKGRPGWEVEDGGSANGTLLNGHRIPDGRVAPLRDGDRIGIGDTVVVFRAGAGTAPGPTPAGGGDDATQVGS